MVEFADDQLRALEHGVAVLRAEFESAPATEPERPRRPRILSRRRLLGSTGLAAASGAAGVMVAAPAQAAPRQAATAASQVTFAPTGQIAATNVQAALAEVDTEKAALRGAVFSGPIDATFSDARFVYRPWSDIRAFGAMGDGATDDTGAILYAIAVAQNTGGGTVLIPPGRYRFKGRIVVPDGVDLWGCGGSNQVDSATGSVLQAIDSTSQVVIQAGGNQTGNFVVDGRKVTGPSSGLLLLDGAVERLFTALRVGYSRSHGLVMRGSQNCSFVQCYVGHCNQDGLVLDDFSWAHLFLRCEFRGCGRDIVKILDTPGDVSGNLFVHCIMESGLWEDGGWNGPNNSALHVQGGRNNRFDECYFVVRQPNTSTSGWLVLVKGGSVDFDSCHFTTDIDGAGCLWNEGSGVRFLGINHLQCASNGVAIRWDNHPTDTSRIAYGSVMGRLAFSTAVIFRWTGSGNHTQLAFETDRPNQLSLEPDAGYALRTMVRGESGYRLQVERTGQISMGDGTTFSAKARWRLQSDGSGWETPDDVFFNGGRVAIQETTNPDPGTVTASNRAVVYVKSDKLVVAFKDGATMRYKWLPLAGTGAAWVDSTTAP